jgi:uncharacterized protein YbaR (Trm112 family)
MIDSKILEIIVCPICKHKLHYDKARCELICKIDQLAFPIDNQIPVMLPEQARKLSADELV